jgi:hypothetical protein
MNENEQPQPALEPVLAVYPDGSLRIGTGYTIGDILNAVELARQAVLGFVPVRPSRPAEGNGA